MARKKFSLEKNKKIFFLAGFPRAGNTLLTSILNQNPDIGCTPNSITLEIYKDIFLIKQKDVFINYPDHKSLDNVLDVVYSAYYKDWNFKYIIDRGPAGTPGNLTLLKKHFKQEIKIIFLVRPLLEVLASWITWANKTPDSFIRKSAKNPTEACHHLMKDDGQIMREIKCMQNLLKSENKHHVHFIDYKEIVAKPAAAMKGIYKFLGIPPFEHRFTNLEQVKVNGLGYDDATLGEGVHTIKTKKLIKSKTDVNILPSEIIKQYGKIKFI
jgi:sulfotransferase